MGRKRSRKPLGQDDPIKECPLCEASADNLYFRGWVGQLKNLRYLGCRKCGREFTERSRSHPLFKARLPLATIREIVLRRAVANRGLRETARETGTRPETVRRIANEWLEYSWSKKPWQRLNVEEEVKFWKGVLKVASPSSPAARHHLERLAKLAERDILSRQDWAAAVSTWAIRKTYRLSAIVKRRALLLLPEIGGETHTPAPN